MEMEILQHRIKYNYFDGDNGDSLPGGITTLDDEYIWKMIMEGYSSGELSGEDYRGWWEIIKT